MKIIGIYKIENLITGKSYIGQSIDIKRRFSKHNATYKNEKDKHYNLDLYKDMRKYGIENFNFEILEDCLLEELNEKETYYIIMYENNTYNKTYKNNVGHFLKLNKEKIENIIYDLSNTNIDNIELGIKYNVSDRTIRDINSGRVWYNEKLTYPIREKKTILYYCKICGNRVSKNNVICLDCYRINSRKVERPNMKTLVKEILESNFLQVSKKYNVSDTAIRKWLKSENVPVKKEELIIWLNNQENKNQ